MTTLTDVLPEFTPLSGVPITIDGKVVGAIDVSSAKSARHDQELAEMTVKAIVEMKRSQAAEARHDVAHFDRKVVEERFARGAPILETSGCKIHASRREKPGVAEVHAHETDVIHVLDGAATFVTGGTVVDPKATEPGEIRGPSISGGTTHRLAKGDVIAVPPGTPYWFKNVAAPFPLLRCKADFGQEAGLMFPDAILLGIVVGAFVAVANAIAAPFALPTRDGRPDAIIDLRTAEGSALAQARWRYRDARIAEIDFRGPAAACHPVQVRHPRLLSAGGKPQHETSASRPRRPRARRDRPARSQDRKARGRLRFRRGPSMAQGRLPAVQRPQQSHHLSLGGERADFSLPRQKRLRWRRHRRASPTWLERLAFDSEGRLTVNEHGNRRVVRIERTGAATVFADRYQGKRLNSPNDLVYKSDGALYFSDPPFGLPLLYEDRRKELPYSGVFMLRDGNLTLLATDRGGPNGIAFLYMTAGTGLYRVRLNVAGIR